MITLTREEAQQVLDALEYTADYDTSVILQKAAIETLRARLAEKEQEPVAWISAEETWLVPKLVISDKPKEGYKPVYTTPPQRPWVGLTDVDISNAWYSAVHIASVEGSATKQFARAIEAKLKEKNSV